MATPLGALRVKRRSDLTERIVDITRKLAITGLNAPAIRFHLALQPHCAGTLPILPKGLNASGITSCPPPSILPERFRKVESPRHAWYGG
jgi:hypothetical protein